ncbi:MAG TPA: hypothetical protein VED01_22455 [Burkholderiales bacterium]|nr:hypothetical protein [Burkholderiales bacterium]
MITNAITLAQNEHTVYFLLTSYLDVRNGHADSGLPARVKRLPIAGKPDVEERLRALSDAGGAHGSPMMVEVGAVLRAASERIASLELTSHADGATSDGASTLQGCPTRQTACRAHLNSDKRLHT